MIRSGADTIVCNVSTILILISILLFMHVRHPIAASRIDSQNQYISNPSQPQKPPYYDLHISAAHILIAEFQVVLPTVLLRVIVVAPVFRNKQLPSGARSSVGAEQMCHPIVVHLVKPLEMMLELQRDRFDSGPTRVSDGVEAMQ